MITLVDYNAGNVTSLLYALKGLGAEVQVSSDPDVLGKASKIIFPGQGAAGAGMAVLKERGLVEVLQKTTVPFLGICLGMQLLFESSEEDNSKGLALVPGRVNRFENKNFKVPHMGWNLVKYSGESPLFKGIPDESFFYFANSYKAPLGESTQGVTFYGEPFSSVIQKNNLFGVQFHPEKSGEMGLKLLSNFLAL
jgi:glutamine amidotransferase